MKEATGELNMTVVTVVAIAAVAAFFYAFVWPSIKTNIINSTKCSSAINCECTDKQCSCQYQTSDAEGNPKYEDVTCPNNNQKNGQQSNGQQ